LKIFALDFLCSDIVQQPLEEQDSGNLKDKFLEFSVIPLNGSLPLSVVLVPIP
jgi:hypothetical protein